MPMNAKMNRSVFLVVDPKADPSGDRVAEALADYPEGRSRGKDIYELPYLSVADFDRLLATAVGQSVDALLDAYHPDRKKRGRRRT